MDRAAQLAPEHRHALWAQELLVYPGAQKFLYSSCLKGQEAQEDLCDLLHLADLLDLVPHWVLLDQEIHSLPFALALLSALDDL